MKYIFIGLYKKIIECALLEGLNREELKKIPTPLENVNNIQAVPASHFFELHEILNEKLDPGFSVRVGQQMKMEDYGVLGLSWRTCSRAVEIFERSERYFKLLSNTYAFKVEKQEEYSHIYLLREPSSKGMELSNEATLSATVVVLRAITETDISPTRVTFKHRQPENSNSYKKAFGCQLLFNQPYYSITYKTADLETRTAKADASINKFLLERVEEETLGLVVSANKIATDVEQLIKDALPNGIPGIHEIAEHIGMSNRTLARRLRENGVTFRDLIKKTQERRALELLANTNWSIAEIAFETGFSEQSAFNRAFKRWQGQSPTQFRYKSCES